MNIKALFVVRVEGLSLLLVLSSQLLRHVACFNHHIIPFPDSGSREKRNKISHYYQHFEKQYLHGAGNTQSTLLGSFETGRIP